MLQSGKGVGGKREKKSYAAGERLAEEIGPVQHKDLIGRV
jgi:hypothetical protein